MLITHPNLTQSGFDDGVGCAIFNKKRDILRMLINDPRMTHERLLDLLLDLSV